MSAFRPISPIQVGSPPDMVEMRPAAYAELQAVSNFSFLRGASHANELVDRAAALGLAAIGIADRNTLAGAVRAHVAAKAAGLRFLTGARLDLACGLSLLCYPPRPRRPTAASAACSPSASGARPRAAACSIRAT